MIKNKKDYLKYFKELRKIVNKHDPMSLMDMAPEDEYDMEVEKILANTYRLDSIKDIENKIYKIFVLGFGNEAKLAKDLFHSIAVDWFEYKKGN